MQMLTNSILEDLDSLPEISNNYIGIIRSINDPDISDDDFASILSAENNLKNKILQLCNSAYYKINRRVPGIAIAYTLLGKPTLKTLTLIATLNQSLLEEPLVGYQIKGSEFWNHLFMVASLSKIIAQEINYMDPEEAFCAGLLHDIGKMIFNRHNMVGVSQAFNMAIFKGEYIWDAEAKVFGIDHAELSARIAENWGLSDYIVKSIKYHHTPEKVKNEYLLASILNIANVISNIAMYDKKDHYLSLISREALNNLEVDYSYIDDALEQLGEIMENASLLFKSKV